MVYAVLWLMPATESHQRRPDYLHILLSNGPKSKNFTTELQHAAYDTTDTIALRLNEKNQMSISSCR